MIAPRLRPLLFVCGLVLAATSGGAEQPPHGAARGPGVATAGGAGEAFTTYDGRTGSFDLAPSLAHLGTDYVALHPIHWPVAGRYRAMWDALQEIHRNGRARSIGWGNFHLSHLEDLPGGGPTVPALNQIEFHPWLAQPESRRFGRDRGIPFEAWNPPMQGRLDEVPTIPKSARPARVVENAAIFDFALPAEDMRALDVLGRDKRLGPDPARFNF